MDYRSMVNPTYLTAKSTLYMLAGAGNGDAKRVIAALDTQNELVQNRRKENGQSLPMPESEVKALIFDPGNIGSIFLFSLLTSVSSSDIMCLRYIG